MFFLRALLKSVFSKCPRISKGPDAINSVNPTSRSATAKLIRRKEVRLSLLRFFQNTNMVKMLPTMMIKDSSMVANNSAITIIALYMIVSVNCSGSHLKDFLMFHCVWVSLAGNHKSLWRFAQRALLEMHSVLEFLMFIIQQDEIKTSHRKTNLRLPIELRITIFN